VDRIRHGFSLGIRPISTIFFPPNRPSAANHATILAAEHANERRLGRYIGPIPIDAVLAVLGPVHVSPQSVIPKSTPGKFRIIQDMSFPYDDPLTRSINSDLLASSHPCTWGTFWATSLLISILPEGSEGAVRDVEAAFRSIPIRPEEWPGLVVRAPEGDDLVDVDTAACFGCRTCPGVHGEKHDAYLDITRAAGMGPCVVWVDDNLFIRIKRCHLGSFNSMRSEIRRRIQQAGGARTSGGRLWYEGGTLADGRREEWVEDFAFPIQDLSGTSPRSAHDAQFTYCFADIDRVASDLGIVFASDKDVPFGPRAPFTGLDFGFASKDVGLPETKRSKYQLALDTFLDRTAVALKDVQSIYGKLLHTCAVVPEGRAYLTGLESFIGSFDDERPFSTRHLPRIARAELDVWWRRTLSLPLPRRPLPVATDVRDLLAFSDASSGVGVGVWIRGRWRAWRLRHGWNADGRGIAWAEAAGFELVLRILVRERLRECHAKVWGDNSGVVEAWWNGRSRDRFVNEVFRRLHPLLRDANITAHTRYVASADNPADGPSRGVYDRRAPLLPPVELGELSRWLVDFDDEHVERDAVPIAGARPKDVGDRERFARAQRQQQQDAVARAVLIDGEAD
jgi:hypothetical protein